MRTWLRACVRVWLRACGCAPVCASGACVRVVARLCVRVLCVRTSLTGVTVAVSVIIAGVKVANTPSYPDQFMV